MKAALFSGETGSLFQKFLLACSSCSENLECGPVGRCAADPEGIGAALCLVLCDPDRDACGEGFTCSEESDPQGGPIFVCAPSTWDSCCVPEDEICGDEIDNNCDGVIDEGFEELGSACDGDDSDLCKNGTWTCNEAADALECVNETLTDLVELCFDEDEDCDGTVDEGFEDLGLACDGDDSDSCKNGTCAAHHLHKSSNERLTFSRKPGASEF